VLGFCTDSLPFRKASDISSWDWLFGRFAGWKVLTMALCDSSQRTEAGDLVLVHVLLSGNRELWYFGQGDCHGFQSFHGICKALWLAIESDDLKLGWLYFIWVKPDSLLA
jgi:uncharacterized ParB-like nuclease family protein